jgi:hypothetical protein
MPPAVRRLALTVHLTCSVGWVGAVFAYLALGAWAATATDADAVRAAWSAMEVIGWWAIVPLALAALVTGLVMSLGTPWGLFRHYWVVVSLALSVLCAVVLLLHMPTVTAIAAMLRGMDMRPGSATMGHGGVGGDLFHAGVGLVVLLAVTVLNVYKPRGLTPYGWRKQQEERAR